MTSKIKLILVPIIFFGMTISCSSLEKSSQTGGDVTNYKFRSIEAKISSRGTTIPITYVSPIEGNEKFPVVIMAHGHGGTRNEAGGFTAVAEGLAKKGIASIRMDFPGCGESTESFTKNNVSNMLKDIQSSQDYALDQPNIDRSKVALFGYSMGGRLMILHSPSDARFKAIALWAPAGANGAETSIRLRGGQSAWDSLKNRSASEGYASYTTSWGAVHNLGLKWFTDMEKTNPLDVFRDYKGSVLVLYGDQDAVVKPQTSEAVISSAINSHSTTRHIVYGAGHGFGLFSNKPELTREAVAVTINFLSEQLR